MSLTISSLTKSFGEKTLFRDFSYIFKERGIYAVTGESGIGKSTLLRIIAGLDKEYCGTVTGGGADKVSMCFQEHRLFASLCAFDNIFKVAIRRESADAKESVRALLRRLKFTDEDMRLKPAELSGGMRQRVALARSILKKSDILILDEATKELDSALTDTVLDIIKEEARHRLVILVTHDPEQIAFLGAEVINITDYR